MSVRLIATAKFPTKFGEFEIYAFSESESEREHLALVNSKKKDQPIAVRIHSKCLTGDTFNSLRCDCNDQLEQVLKYLGKKQGVLIYLDQEGRGIGLCNKIRAYELQDKGLDTVDANLSLGFAEDLRKYDDAAEILRILKITNIDLITNNPQKIEELKKYGINVNSRIPLLTKPTKHNEKYLKTKKERMEHML